MNKSILNENQTIKKINYKIDNRTMNKIKKKKKNKSNKRKKYKVLN